MNITIRNPQKSVQRALTILLVTCGAVLFSILFYLGLQTFQTTLVYQILPAGVSNNTLTYNLVITVAILLIYTLPKAGFFGLSIGTAFSNYGLFLKVAVPALIVEIAYLKLGGSSPYSGLGWQYYVLVPVSEELFFRGFLFSLISLVLRGMFSKQQTATIAMFVSAIAFSAAHLQNFGSLTIEFLLLQCSYAFVLGLLFALLRHQTSSLIPSTILHGLFNFIGVLQL